MNVYTENLYFCILRRSTRERVCCVNQQILLSIVVANNLPINTLRGLFLDKLLEKVHKHRKGEEQRGIGSIYCDSHYDWCFFAPEARSDFLAIALVCEKTDSPLQAAVITYRVTRIILLLIVKGRAPLCRTSQVTSSKAR